jgi:hypothetical protein
VTTNKKPSTWRQREEMLSPNVVNTLIFTDTKPNHILINNLGEGELYFSATGLPSESIYDKKVSTFGEVFYAQELGLTRIQIFVKGTNPNRVKVTSFEADFNPASVSTSAPIVSGGGSGGVAESVSINGFSVALPAGSNNIGKVIVTEMPAQTFELATLPAGTNNIGKVNVETLPPLAAGSSHIGSVNVDNAITIESMPPVQVSSNPVRAKHHVFDGEVGTTLVTFDMTENGTVEENIQSISYIDNEGSTDLFIGFDNDIPTATTSTGKNKQIRIKAGETLSDLHRQCSKVHFIRATGGGNVRLLGV